MVTAIQNLLTNYLKRILLGTKQKKSSNLVEK